MSSWEKQSPKPGVDIAAETPSILSELSQFFGQFWPALLVLAIVSLASCSPIGSNTFDDLDSAHDVMDGIFFRDAFVQHPIQHPVAFAMDYYKQYPALGFVFWPPFYPLVESAFFLVGGVNLVAARICLFCFVLLFALFVYMAASRRYGRWLGAVGTLLLFLTPLVFQHALIILLEIPTLALAFLTVFFYDRLMRSEEVTWSRILLFCGASLAAIYTKQTIAFIFPMFALDLVVNHRGLLRDKKIWAAVGIVAIALLPLAAFTLTVGNIGIKQSIGNDKSMVLTALPPPDQWSPAAWIYYFALLPEIMNPIVLILGLAALAYGLINRSFLKKNLLWFGWVLFWFVQFMSFVNKQPRFTVFWIPGWIMLILGLAHELSDRKQWVRGVAYAALTAGLILNLRPDMKSHTQGYSGMDAVVAQELNSNARGNILYFGTYRQAFVPYVRMLDKSGKVHVLQGEKLVGKSSTIAQVCHDYQIASIMFDSGRAAPTFDSQQLLQDPSLFQLAQSTSIGTPTQPARITVFTYRGEIASKMAEIPLRPRLVDQGVADRLVKK